MWKPINNFINGEKRYILNLSGGKDSVALLLKAIDDNLKIDEVACFLCDWDYDSIRLNLDKCEKICKKNNILFTRLKPKKDFDYLAFDEKRVDEDGNPKLERGFCGIGAGRWGTGIKMALLDKNNKGKIPITGLAFDEQKRLERTNNIKKINWLVDWKMTEAEALEYCRKKGFKWLEKSRNGLYVDLYDIMDRTGCYCCGLSSLKTFYAIWKYLPSYWNKIIERQQKTTMKINTRLDAFELEEKFENHESGKKLSSALKKCTNIPKYYSEEEYKEIMGINKGVSSGYNRQT